MRGAAKLFGLACLAALAAAPALAAGAYPNPIFSGWKITGSSTGVTTFASANASASNYTITFPAATGTVALTSNIATALPSALATQFYIGTGAAGVAGVGSTGTHLAISGGTLSTDATNANTPSTIAARDASGNAAFAGLTGTSVTDSGLSTQGAVCNSALGALSTSTTGCANEVQAVANGGTGAATASGTALDNITGFASIGFIKRTGAGAYSFVTDPSDVTAVSNSDGTLTISPTTGAVVASLALSHANTWGAVQTFTNSDIALLGSSTGKTTFTSANAGASNFTLTFPAVTETLAGLGGADQTLSGGANLTVYNPATGNYTVDCGQNPGQWITNGGAFTITAPAADGMCVLQIENNGSAGAVTWSGFTEGSNTGDALDTTNAHKFQVSITRIHSISHYLISALQ